ncbi:hypothetical protein P5G65_20480 [Paenibacillus chondroitinus]|uniref:Uncharacterized protein n=1 Tax=Paenibacillus chondroitinus TaxID=59842 RepID=A0ABU6DEV3_9BACL|nr:MULTISPECIES: hypothetical protein [Paenibacillus]MCY9661519.1 hypothetical protein [Paenibacillus anseongense]MEB4796287.1 hypothetical protein [Paenibacillus chondroitinus]
MLIFTQKGSSALVLVYFLVLTWYCLHVLVTLPKKLPLMANVLLYMLLSIIDINRMALFSNNLSLYRFSTQVPEFLSMILYRDFIYCFTLLTFANVYLTASRVLTRVLISVYTFLFLLMCCFILNRTAAIISLTWNTYYDSIMLLIIMFVTYGLGRWLLHFTRKEKKA